MTEEIKIALDQLRQLDPSSNPYEEVKQLIAELRPFGCIAVNLLPGKTIIRARQNEKDERFFSKCQLTYKPQQFNETYQRASTPNQTMFYGSVIPDIVERNELDNARIISSAETLEWLVDRGTKGIRKITFGRWQVVKPIKLFAVVQHESFRTNNHYTKELYEAFINTSKNNPEIEEQTIAITDFFANEFAKPVSSDNHLEYIKSATFAETIIDSSGLDGVFYPSVKTKGDGFNIALRPDIADTHLELLVAGECTLYKYYDQSVFDNETAVILNPNQTNFTFHQLNSSYHAGQEKCLEKLGLKSVDELA
jgi:hypothetical protein